MRATSIFFMVLALVAAAFGIWVLVGVAAFVVRVLALVFLTIAVLNLRKKVVSGQDP